MRLNRKPVYLLSIICVLLFGVCFDNIEADSFLACLSSCEDGIICGAPVLHPQRRNPPAEQAYAPKALNQGEAFLVPCRAMPRNASRPGRSLIFAALPADSLFSQAASLHMADVYVEFHEISSHTAIISYIHRQDGEKA